MSLTKGQTLQSRYRIVKLLGQGGFGAVYRTWDLNLNTPCALKENLDSSPEAARQFTQEARILATLRHPNLPRVTDHFTIAGQGQYLVMDFVDGEDLEEILAKSGRPLDEGQVVEWAVQVCDALGYLHLRTPPVIHRDVKPANVKITPGDRAVLVDFGIAKTYDPVLRTTIGAQAVTPGFSPFEQYGKGGTDARTDIYALGATMYALLTGQEPPESIARIGGTSLPAPRSRNHNISTSTERVILKAMEVMPGDRYQSTGEIKKTLVTCSQRTIASQLSNVAESSPRSTVTTPTPPPLSSTRGPRWAWIVAVVGVLLIAWLAFQAQRPAQSTSPVSIGIEVGGSLEGDLEREMTPDVPLDLLGSWEGEWTNPEGFLYTCVMELNHDSTNSISGKIIWTLNTSPRSELQPKIGFEATEYLRGTYDPKSSLIYLEGYDKYDPNTIIGLDKYRLTLSEDGNDLEGETHNNGDWQGRLTVVRKR